MDWDHLSRFERYVLSIRESISTTTGVLYQQVTGYIVADRLDKEPEFTRKIALLEQNDMYALNWHALLDKALASWRDFLDILEERGEGDFRMAEHFEAVRGEIQSLESPATDASQAREAI